MNNRQFKQLNMFHAVIKHVETERAQSPDTDGLFLLQPKAPATITLTVSGNGVQTQTTSPFEVKKGDSIIKNFVSKPVANGWIYDRTIKNRIH